MRPRRTVVSNKVFRLAGGTEDNDLWTHVYTAEDGGPAIGSTWQLTDEERAAIADGANVELLVFGTEHPPVTMRLSDYQLGKPPPEETDG